MEGLLKLFSMVVTLLIIWGVIVLMAGGKPKECPRHICYPKNEIVSAEQLLAQRAEEAKKAPPVAGTKP